MIATPLLAVSLLALAPAPASGGDVDDLVPARVDALLAEPKSPIFFGQPLTAVGVSLFRDTEAPANARTLVALPDIDEDGTADLAIGYDDQGARASLHARSGATGELLWSARPDDGFFRLSGGLARAEGVLALAVTSPGARVELRDATDGSVLWATDLAAPAEGEGGVLAGAYRVRFAGDLDGDGTDDLLVAAGRGVDAVVALSGTDGHELWRHATGDAVYDVTTTPDRDGDGTADVAWAGGDDSPALGLLSGADGSPLWSVPLPGTGTAVAAGGDLDDDGLGDLVVGTFNQPATCMFAHALADGAPLWSADFVIDDDVLSIDPISDVDDDGLVDWTVAGFDNAANAVTATGFVAWRKEFTTNNGGQVLAARPAGDLDGEGAIDVLCTSMDQFVYVIDGRFGHYLWSMDLRARGSAVAALPDPDGGKPALAVAGQGVVEVFDGGSGLASGPEVFFSEKAGELNVVAEILAFTYPGAQIFMFGSLGTDELVLPGWDQPFGLDLATLGVVAAYPGPPAGGQGFHLPPFIRDFVGETVHVQVAQIYQNGHRLLSDVESFDIVGD